MTIRQSDDRFNEGGGMTPENFRDFFPFHSAVNGLAVVTDDEPTFTTFCTLTITDNLPAGKYLLTPVFTWSMPDVNDSAIFRVVRTGGPVTPIELRDEPKDNNNVVGRSIPALLVPDWPGGPMTVTLEASKTAGAADLTIYASQIMLECKERA